MHAHACRRHVTSPDACDFPNGSTEALRWFNWCNFVLFMLLLDFLKWCGGT